MAAPDPEKNVWTILNLITWGTGYLAERKFDEARLTIELLLSHVLQLSRIQLYTRFDQPLSEDELARFKSLLKRRLAHEPLHYITGTAEFFGLPFLVTPHVLIPRPETEVLVDHALSLLSSRGVSAEPLTILDLGTGSGCIAVALAARLPNAQITAADISPEALSIATENAAQNGVQDRVTFLRSSFADIPVQCAGRLFHAILSNPPYVSSKEYAELSPDVREFEPKISLTDNANGLKFYPEIAHLAWSMLESGGFVGVEHAYDQSEPVAAIFRSAGFRELTIVKDFAKIDRHLFAVKE